MSGSQPGHGRRQGIGILAEPADDDRIVPRTDIAVGNADVSGIRAMDTVIIGDQGIIVDRNAPNDGMITISDTDRPLRRILQVDIRELDVLASFEGDEQSRTVRIGKRTVFEDRTLLHKIFALTGVFPVKIMADMGLIDAIHKISAVAIDLSRPANGDMSGIFRKDQPIMSIAFAEQRIIPDR